MESPTDQIFENYISPDNLTDLPSSAGLVLFTDNQNLPILLLSAANIRRAAKTKLAERAEKTKKADLKSITAKIYYKTCPCKFRLSIEHYKAAKLIFASNYKDHIIFVYPWFIKADLNNKIPFFSITPKPSFNNGEKTLGPFTSQKSASGFLNALEDAFKLCRRNDLVHNPQHASGCPYLQMDACCGVCSGKISPDEYKNIMNDAFGTGAEPAKTIENLRTDMQTASKELNFEKAAELKRKIEKLSALKNPSYKWTADLEKLKIVHIDKAGKIKPQNSKKKIQTHAVFVMNFFEIIDLGNFLIDDKDKIYEAIQNALNKLNGPQESGGTEILERFAIISYFLYRSKPAGLWLKADEYLNRHNLLSLKDI
ncbi:MAG: UvrB/UvrC motif-containing protein [Sedimentisphaerales bacterium]